MERWSRQQRAFAVKAFYQNDDSFVRAQRAFRNEFHLPPRAPVPSAKAISLWVRNFEATSSTTRKRGGSARTRRTPENINRTRLAIERSPRTSARRHSVALGLSVRTVRRILKIDLHYHPYKIQIVQALHPQDHRNRLHFCQQMLHLIEEDGETVHNLWMSDEAHFHLSGYVNKQNFRYWSQNNPQHLHEKPLHSEKVTVWCAISSMGIIGPFFFTNEIGDAVTVNSRRYTDMLQTFFLPALDNYDTDENTRFQQDGATSHTARIAMDVLRTAFPGRLISRNGDIPWPARSPDLTAPDFFLWGYLKSQVFKHDAPRTIDDLQARIRLEINNIPLEMLRNVMNSFERRLRECAQNQGRHLSDTIFKK